MSRAAALSALTAAVSADVRYKVVERADVPIVAQKLPCAAVCYDGDESSGEGLLAEARTYRFLIRIYVRLGADLRVAQDDLLALIDTLDANLETNRVLTARTEIIGRADGSMEPVKFSESGPDLLCYSVSVRVEIKPVRDVVLSDGGQTVTITDLTAESIPLAAGAAEYLPSADGLVAYVADAPELRRLAGRVASAAEAQALACWCSEDTSLTYTDLDALLTAGWRIAGSPAPRLDRTLTPSAGYTVDITLWRIV
jgi:hypothetical protein